MRSIRVLVSSLGLIIVSAGAARADADKGKEVFMQCLACHLSEPKNSVGPTLFGVVGRKSASVPGFRYSRALKKAGLTWDEKTLGTFLTNPQQAVPGNQMPFAGIPDLEQRTNLIKYLATLKQP